MRRAVILFFFILSFALGLGIGSWLGVERRASTFSEGVRHRLAEAAAPLPASDRSQSAVQGSEELISSILSALREEQPLYRAHRLHELLSNLGSPELAVLFQRSLQLKGRERETILRPILARWEALDPAVAEEAMQPFVAKLRAGKPMLWGSIETSALDAWARARPELALACAAANADAGSSRWFARIALQTMAPGDPAKRLAILSGMPPTVLRSNLAEEALMEVSKVDAAAAEQHLELLTNVKQRDRIQAAILDNLADRDPEAALERVAEIATEVGCGTRGVQLVSSVFSKAALKDPQAVLAAAENLPEGLRSAASGAALVGWIDKSPREALEWGQQNGVDIRNARASVSFGSTEVVGWRTAIFVAFEKDREGALAWLREQPLSPERDALLGEGLYSSTLEQRIAIYNELTPEARIDKMRAIILGGYKANDLQGTEKFVEGLPAGLERTRAVESLVGLQVDGDTARADQIISAYPPGPERDAAAMGAVNALSQKNQQRALECASQIGDSTRREEAYVALARTWLVRDRPGALAWLNTTQFLDSEVKRVLLRQANER
jgi:hypothetical protein